LFVLGLALTFVIDVEKPDVAITANVLASELRKLFEPVPMVEPKVGKPVLVVANDNLALT
jgi:hypothetical protein